jgi:SAM-dependent MidA family methyltransferase
MNTVLHTLTCSMVNALAGGATPGQLVQALARALESEIEQLYENGLVERSNEVIALQTSLLQAAGLDCLV